MLSLYRSLMRTRSIVSTVAAGSRRNLVLSSQRACEQARALTQPAPTPSAEEGVKRREIFASKSMEELHSLIQPSLNSMSPKRLMDCMLHSLNLAKRQPPEYSAQEDQIFQVLAGTVLSKIRHFETNDCVQLARFAGNLKLDCSASFVQGIYQMIRGQINELDLDQIMTLRRSLRNLQGSSELTDALKVSLPLVFETQVERQLDTTNQEMCLKALRFVASSQMKAKTRDFVAGVAGRFLQDATPQVAAEVIYGVAFQEQNLERQGHSKMRNVLKQCFGIVAANLPHFDEKSVRRIMVAYSKVDMPRKDLHDALWARAADWSFVEMMRLVKLSLVKRTMGPQDVDVLASFILANKSSFLNPGDQLTLIEVVDCSYILAMHVARIPGICAPQYIELGNLFAGVLSRCNVQLEASPEEKPELFVRFLINILILGVYPKEALDLAFSDRIQEKFLTAPLANIERLIDMERLARLHFGESCKYAVKPELREHAARGRRRIPLDASLVQSLEAVLGGEEFLLKNAVSPSGVEADLVAVIRESGYPVALRGKPFSFEDLPSNCKVVAFLDCVLRRDIEPLSGRFKLNFALKERFLRAENIIPIIISRFQWAKLPENEKIPFIKKQLKEEASCHVRTDPAPKAGSSVNSVTPIVPSIETNRKSTPETKSESPRNGPTAS